MLETKHIESISFLRFKEYQKSQTQCKFVFVRVKLIVLLCKKILNQELFFVDIQRIEPISVPKVIDSMCLEAI